jgi:hypothetical protein
VYPLAPGCQAGTVGAYALDFQVATVANLGGTVVDLGADRLTNAWGPKAPRALLPSGGQLGVRAGAVCFMTPELLGEAQVPCRY